jgi:hypothetical protein
LESTTGYIATYREVGTTIISNLQAPEGYSSPTFTVIDTGDCRPRESTRAPSRYRDNSHRWSRQQSQIVMPTLQNASEHFPFHPWLGHDALWPHHPFSGGGG